MSTVRADIFEAAAGSGAAEFGSSGDPDCHIVRGTWKGPNRVNALSSASYTVLDADGYDTLLYTTGGTNRTCTLPAVGTNTGRIIQIKKVDSGSGTVAISPASGTIDGASSVTIIRQYDQVTVMCDGTNWHIVSRTHRLKTYDVGTAYTNGTCDITGTGLSSKAGSIIPFQTEDGAWWISAQISFNTGSTSTTDFTVSGVTFSGIAAVAAIDLSVGTAVTVSSRTSSGSGTIISRAAAAGTNYAYGFTAKLSAKPTWAD